MFVIYCSDSELTSSVTTYLASNPPARVTALFYSHGRKNVYAKDFPVNLLRNVGIRAVRTSHFLVLDMDMWVNGCEKGGGVRGRRHVRRGAPHPAGIDGG